MVQRANGEMDWGRCRTLLPKSDRCRPVRARTLRRIPEADLPGTHVGINAGPVVYENGDFYGRTVNIAARIAAYAEQGQVLVSEDVVSAGSTEEIRFRRLGPVSFKGVSRDVVVYKAERA